MTKRWYDIDELNEKLAALTDFLGVDEDLRDLGYSKEHLIRILSLCNEKMMHPEGSPAEKIQWLNMISQKSVTEKKDNIPSIPEALFLVYSRMFTFIDKKSCPEFGKFANHNRGVVYRAGERLKSAAQEDADNKIPEKN